MTYLCAPATYAGMPKLQRFQSLKVSKQHAKRSQVTCGSRNLGIPRGIGCKDSSTDLLPSSILNLGFPDYNLPFHCSRLAFPVDSRLSVSARPKRRGARGPDNPENKKSFRFGLPELGWKLAARNARRSHPMKEGQRESRNDSTTDKIRGVPDIGPLTTP